ncbi:hypothetical protein HF909_10290 [Ralstonia pseudosolanacearum]|uniref:Uncharacterized protein n=1 Tax=Ralstonia solanacearum TaxID=305 RepID=A0AA92K226_RALSL|nr:hypothetical protein [Ralstonia pseudosolanacearum]QOK96783.1 hypothetical protein HF909_10290 [Ralstonia pseudosolanacearum]
MSGPTITMCPTMANPEAFNTIAELREELHRANATILKMADQLHSLNCIAQEVGERLGRMVLGHMRGDQDTVKRELDDLVAHHVKAIQKSQGGLH